MGIVDGFSALFAHWQPVMFALVGTLVGLVAGALPGLSGSATIALLIPLTFYMDTLSALVFIYTISKAADFGGSIPAILFNTPGTPQATATQIEGYPLTLQGKQNKALRMAVISSAQGDIVSELMLIFGAASISLYAARMGPPEYTAVYFCAFIIIGSLIGESVVKGLISTLLGILIALIGYDSITAEPRFTFGFDYLAEGLPIVPVLLGVFVMSEVFVQVAKRAGSSDDRPIAKRSDHPDDNRVTWPEYRRCFPVITRSTGIGILIGMLPGVGATVACWVSYAEARRSSKRRKTWGKGELEGIAAVEASNNATSGANLIPLLTLGIPGSTTAALLASVMLLHGVTLGSAVFVTSHDLVYGLFASGLMCILIYLIVGYWGSGYVGKMIAIVPARMIYPIIFMTCFVAAYAYRQALFDLVLVLLFGVIGYLMKRLGFSIPAFIIAYILGGEAEHALRQTMILDDNGIWIFLDRPLAMLFFGLGFLALIYRFRANRKRRILKSKMSSH